LKILHQPRRSEERPDNSPDKAAMPSVKRLRRSAASEPAPAAALNRCGWKGRNYLWNYLGIRDTGAVYPIRNCLRADALAALLKHTIAADPFPMSSRIRQLRAILEKLEPPAARPR
jgi:hypothetical protein